MQTMRLATDSCRRLIDRLTSEYNTARRASITDALMEIVAGFEASGRQTNLLARRASIWPPRVLRLLK
jgi:hypothetical protein